jgi:hypothetical protein
MRTSIAPAEFRDNPESLSDHRERPRTSIAERSNAGYPGATMPCAHSSAHTAAPALHRALNVLRNDGACFIERDHAPHANGGFRAGQCESLAAACARR